jgi:hypothetical protein
VQGQKAGSAKIHLLQLQEQQSDYNHLRRQYLTDCKKLRQLDYKIRQEANREEN